MNGVFDLFDGGWSVSDVAEVMTSQRRCLFSLASLLLNREKRKREREREKKSPSGKLIRNKKTKLFNYK